VELSRYMRSYEAKLSTLTEFELRTTISSFQQATAATPNEVEHTVLWRKGDRMRAEAFGTITLQDKSLCVLVDPEERMIQVSRPEGSLTTVDAEARTIMFMAAKQVRKSADPLGVRFQLTFPANATYSTLEVVFDKQGWLRSITTVWARPMPLEPSNPVSAMVRPKVCVEMSVPQPIARAVDLDIAKLVDRRSATIQGVGAYAGYDVFDTRMP